MCIATGKWIKVNRFWILDCGIQNTKKAKNQGQRFKVKGSRSKVKGSSIVLLVRLAQLVKLV
jgi:hypothetical protein